MQQLAASATYSMPICPLFGLIMSNWLFTARQRFTPDSRDDWIGYLEWIGFPTVQEVVTLDHLLCPDLIDELQAADWDHNVHEDYRTMLFKDSDYLRQRCHWRPGHDQLIAMIESPETEELPPPGFTQCGFDIVDAYNDISVLTNCGPFPKIIDSELVNSLGLLPTLSVALSVAEELRNEFSADSHCCDCAVWQIARDIDPAN